MGISALTLLELGPKNVQLIIGGSLCSRHVLSYLCKLSVRVKTDFGIKKSAFNANPEKYGMAINANNHSPKTVYMGSGMDRDALDLR